jgi:hypothetical protein
MAPIRDLADSLEVQGIDMEVPMELVRPLLLDVVSPDGQARFSLPRCT